jgi:hypothetical protein
MRPSNDSHAVRHRDRGRVGRRLRRDLQAPLDLAHVLEILIDPHAVRRAELTFEARERARDRVEDAALLRAPRGALFGRAAVAE